MRRVFLPIGWRTLKLTLYLVLAVILTILSYELYQSTTETFKFIKDNLLPTYSLFKEAARAR